MSIFRRWVWLGSLLFLAAVGCGDAPTAREVRLVEVGPYGVTLAWETDTAHRFAVSYGEGAQLDRQAVEEAAGTAHRLVLGGLKPSTRYQYRLAPNEPVRSFRTAPDAEGAFDLLVVAPNASLCAPDASPPPVVPDVLVRTGPCPAPWVSPDALLIETPLVSPARAWRFGTARLVAAADARQARQALTALGDEQGRLIVVLPELPPVTPAGWNEAVLVAPEAVRFGDRTWQWPAKSTIWLEVDSFEIARVDAARTGGAREVIVAAPPEARKSCLYCDRLLESGRYEESLAWYRAFLKENEERYAVEDTRWQIARLLDEKLFRYPAAIAAYETFLERYPQSRRASLVRHRLAYLAARAAHDFAPLATFERTKANLDRDDPSEAIAAVEAMLHDYPRATVGEDALLWLGHLLEKRDPERARRHYRQLLERFPDSENAAMAAVSLGDMRYRAKQYRQAVAAYEQAAAQVPPAYQLAVADKLRKSKRNIKREIARWIAWAVLAIWLVATVRRRAWPHAADGWFGGALLAAYAVLAGAYFLLNYDRAQNLLTTVAAMLLVLGLIPIWNRALARAAYANRWVLLHAGTASLAALYLVLYHFHALYVFGV